MRRSLTSITWIVAANLTQLVLFLTRSILLTRWLPVDVFGVYTAAVATIAIVSIIPNWGMEGAFLHRAKQVENEQETAAIHFTLKFIFTVIWVIMMVLFAVALPGERITVALVTLVITTAIAHLTQTPSLILSRRVVYRRLALLQIVNAVVTIVISLILAWLFLLKGNNQFALWALLSSHVVAVVLNIFYFYIWRPVWRPKFAWDIEIVCYFIKFGSQNFLATLLVQLLDRVDDLWTSFYLGNTALGYYSRAYRFATYPREVVARPINTVIQGTYAEQKGDRAGLSKSFFHSTAFLIRSGFLLAGLLALIAPEFIRIVLTAKWLPMLDVFRLMLVFTLLDPLKMTVGNLMVAVGKASRPIPARLVQLVILVIGLYWLGPRWGIKGVAIAVNVMALTGIAILFWQAKADVDFSIRKLFLMPLMALALGLLLGQATLFIPGILGSDWRTAVAKAIIFVLVYATILLFLERKQTITLVKMAWEDVRR